jgi:multidrug efflux pump
MGFIRSFVDRKRVFLFSMFLLMLFGLTTYQGMPKESFPDVNIPVMIATITDVGISPEDGERLIAKPLEKEFKGITSLKELTSRCYEGYCNIILEFEVGSDPEKGLRETKDAVDKARPYMPKDIDEPEIKEINTSECPVAIVNIYGNAPEKTLIKVAEDLQDIIETVPGVLEAEMGGKRKEQVEIVINPARIDSYKISIANVTSFFSGTNVLIPAGNIETRKGSFPIKVPGLIKGVTDIINLPVKVSGDAVIKLYDIAEVRRNFENATEFVRMNGQPSLSLEVKKRVGYNTINTVAGVREALGHAVRHIPENIVVTITNDSAQKVAENLIDLQNNVISAMVLVIVCVMLMLGARSGVLVGFSIPVSFLLGIVFLASLGVGINMVVLVGLILAVGLLVDGAIVITEYADKRMTEGVDRITAYGEAASRMFIPVVTSTLTTLMAFAPLMFWPGIMGEFIRFLPLTVICILGASLVIALVCVPIMGAMIGKPGSTSPEEEAQIIASEHGRFDELKGYMKLYDRVLDWTLARPKKVMVWVIAALFASFILYGRLGVGVELFPKSEPDFININIHARGNLSIEEKAALTKEAEVLVFDMPYFKNVYSRTGAKSRFASEDVIGYLQLELKDWESRPRAQKVMKELEEKMSSMAGVIVEINEERKGPSSSKPIEIEISAVDDNQKLIEKGYAYVDDAMKHIGGFTSVENTLPLPGIQWEMEINKAQAAKFGVNISSIGSIVQMMTRGAKVSSYMPEDLDEEIDMVVKFPVEFRSLDMIDNLYVVTAPGDSVPLSSFVKIVPAPKVNMIERINSSRVIKVAADVEAGQFAAAKVQKLKEWTVKNPVPENVRVAFRGEDEDSRESMSFIGRAFILAICMMFFVMLVQFNSFYSTFIIMFSIVLSTIGVILGLIAMRDPFSIMMTGLAVVALAGIVINNNIVLIDAYDEIKKKVSDPIVALKMTGLQRLRPVYLTTMTTVLGMLPMAMKLNVDFVNANLTIGAPSMAMWAAFARSMIFGLGFSTVLTLVVTPCMLLLGIRARKSVKDWFREKFRKNEISKAEAQDEAIDEVGDAGAKI